MCAPIYLGVLDIHLIETNVCDYSSDMEGNKIRRARVGAGMGNRNRKKIHSFGHIFTNLGFLKSFIVASTFHIHWCH